MQNMTDNTDGSLVTRDLAFQEVIDEADAFLASLPTQGLCVYCGDPASQWDHVVPHSFLTVERRRSWDSGVLPSCPDCNHRLSNLVFDTMSERLAYLFQRVKQKHKKLLNSPDWTEAELKELSPRLRQTVRRMIEEQRSVRNRVRYLGRGSFATWLDLYAQDIASSMGKPVPAL